MQQGPAIMHSASTPNLAEHFLFSFTALFAIINPYGLSFIFLRRTLSLTSDERKFIARKVALFAFAVLVVSLFAGATILGFFGISLPALRIGGGLVVAVSGWSMLHEPVQEHDSHAASNETFEKIKAWAFFPLTMPLTTGPGTIATAIALTASRPARIGTGLLLVSAVSVLVAAAVAATILHAYCYAGTIGRLLGREGTQVMTRLSAFLLLCIGVQIVLTGVRDGLPPLGPS